MTITREFRVVDTADRIAIVTSAACVIHCLALPLLLAALPALSRVIQLPESVHPWLVAFAVPVSGYALLAGGNRHRARHPLVVGAVGLVMLIVGAFVVGESTLETPVTVAGGLLVVTAHFLNWRQRHAGRFVD